MWFPNTAELDLFHAVVSDLRQGKHPGNRISVPLLRQGTLMKRQRTGFFSLKHAVRPATYRAMGQLLVCGWHCHLC